MPKGTKNTTVAPKKVATPRAPRAAKPELLGVGVEDGVVADRTVRRVTATAHVGGTIAVSNTKYPDGSIEITFDNGVTIKLSAKEQVALKLKLV